LSIEIASLYELSISLPLQDKTLKEKVHPYQMRFFQRMKMNMNMKITIIGGYYWDPVTILVNTEHHNKFK